tara:strand:- start:177 stop:392 length:216 start_codon:yes stop_codon:yes gene_type:complete
MRNQWIVTLEITTPQPNWEDDKVATVVRRYPKTLATADGLQGMRLDNWSFCLMALAEFPDASVQVIDVTQA